MKRSVFISNRTSSRSVAEGAVPLIDVAGTARDAGRMLGELWLDALRLRAADLPAEPNDWWRQRRYAKLIDRHAPHLPDLFRGMAHGASVPEEVIESHLVQTKDGCTSFAIAPRATLEGHPISGQTKDTPPDRTMKYQVLRLALSDGPSMLTVTYPGYLMGYGFVAGRCAIFSNSLYCVRKEEKPNQPSLAAWGMLALHCRNVQEVIEFSKEYGCRSSGHRTVADEDGGVAGLEFVNGRLGVLRPQRGVYTHANAIVTSRLRRQEVVDGGFPREDSLFREHRLRELFMKDHGRLTPQLAYAAMCDQMNHPLGICRAEGRAACTTAAIVAEPTRRRLHVTRGRPSENWPVTYML